MHPKWVHIFAILILLFSPLRAASALDVIVISDLNGSYGSTSYSPRVDAAIKRIIEINPDLVISTGDMVAGQRKPHLSEPEVRAMWRAFHQHVSDPLRKAGIPLAVTPGNHDASAYGGFEHERAIFADEWSARKPDVKFRRETAYPFSYAFEMDGIMFVSLDATTIGALSGDQVETLTSLGDGKSPIVTFSHLPLWPFAQKRETEIIGDPLLETAYQKAGVVLHLSGHHHAYYPGWKDGIAYVSQACLGGGTRALIGDRARSRNSVTHVRIDSSGDFEVRALTGPAFDTVLDPESLPEKIGVLRRLDLAR